MSETENPSAKSRPGAPASTAHEIRQRFLDFFAERQHRIVPSAPVVPHGDATLMFTNAGMNQFKDVFLGTGRRDYTRAADTQKCIRVSGKHNDLEEVGADTYHHTFFEMLGNWSFGDYFKREAIRWAYEFLVGEMGLDASRLYATVFGGDEALGLGPDEEAEALWPAETEIPPERVLRFGRKDNFWEMADTGPCGPSSEVHLDLGPEACDRSDEPGHRCGVNGDCGRYIEIWNLVFIQHNHLADGRLEALPQKHVDTGMGFERLVAVCQGQRSNYDTDVFAPLLRRIGALTGKVYGAAPRTDMAMRVVADHVRTLAVAIADNVVPSNKDRGYVLRRILRRASRYGYQVLEQREPFIHRVVPTVAEGFASVFPEIAERADHIQRVVEVEESSFLRTLERGLALFEEAMHERERRGETDRPFDGATAFRLYETFGFPRDLTELMCRERGIAVDWEAWDQAEAEHKAASRGEEREGLDAAALDVEGLPPTEFVGYWEQLGEEAARGVEAALGVEAEAALLRLVAQRHVVLDRTPFYAEAGGQIGDTGFLEADGFRFEVEDTTRLGDVVVHHGALREGDAASPPRRVTARVHTTRRRDIMANHTATHLLHAALRQVVSRDATQKGSLVHPDHLRFDFTFDAALGVEQLEEIERQVNAWIADNLPVSIAEESFQSALDRGVTALFGEKYGDRVRVVSVGDVSMELCGGTHCRSTGEIGLFQIVSEKAISAGVRRIVAETRGVAVERTLQMRRTLQEVAQRLGVAPDALVPRIDKLLAEQRELRKGRQQAARADVGTLRRRLLDEAEEVEGVRLVFGQVSDLDMKQAAELADAIRGGEPPAVGVLVTAAAGKKPPGLVAFASAVLADEGRADATALARAVGKGGGRKDFAKGAAAGHADEDSLRAALDAARKQAREQLGGQGG